MGQINSKTHCVGSEQFDRYCSEEGREIIYQQKIKSKGLNQKKNKSN